ncbi:MAG: TonB-dependent receptor [bacterium]|nr:MAG: TonB-dependent receptor [bacterium]
MKKTLAALAAVSFLMSPDAVLSEVSPGDDVPEVVVTATRLDTPADQVSGTILVITDEDIRRKQARTVADALQGLPGVDLISQGGPGKTTSVLLRGGDTRFTLVLVDGVEVNDPSNPERTFDFAHMATDDVERIEVLFGPQSTLYGSDAIGGVIQIITKKGTEDPRIEVAGEAGSFHTRRVMASSRGKGDYASWSLSAMTIETDGISAASEADGNRERDGYENKTLSGRLGVDLGAGASVQINIRQVDAHNELDHYGGPGGDDPNFTGYADQVLLQGRLSMFPSGIWESLLSLSSNVHERRDLNQPDPARDFVMELDFQGRSRKAEWVNNFYLGENSIVTVGLDTERETAESSFFSTEFGSPYLSTLDEKSATINGLFVQEQYTGGAGGALTLGIRTDDHSDFGKETTFRAGFSRTLSPGARFRAVYGTGFRAPSIDQLFNPDYGNPDLDAERSRGWDVGFETSLGKGVTVSVSWYLTEYDNLIAWFDADGDPATWWDGSYQNISEARTEGLDLVLDARFGPVSLGGTASLLRTEDDQGEELLRRPRTRLGAQLGFKPASRTSLDLDASWVDERKDWGDVILASYTLVNLAGAYRISGALELTGRVVNLLDEEYEEAAGYGTPGMSGYLGLRAEL